MDGPAEKIEVKMEELRKKSYICQQEYIVTKEKM